MISARPGVRARCREVCILDGNDFSRVNKESMLSMFSTFSKHCRSKRLLDSRCTNDMLLTAFPSFDKDNATISCFAARIFAIAVEADLQRSYVQG